MTSSSVADAWVAGMQRAGDRIRRGVESVTVAPTARAAAASELWQRRVSDPETRSAYERGLRGVSLEDWRNAMLSRGLPRIASGAAQSRGRFEAFMGEFLPFVEGVAARVRSMPADTLEDRIQRMVAQARGVAEFRGRSRR